MNETYSGGITIRDVHLNLNLDNIHDTSEDANKYDKPLHTKESFSTLNDKERALLIAVDGMWWSLEKWAKQANVTTETLQGFIKGWVHDGTLLQAPYGARSYRMPLRAILLWHENNKVVLGSQLLQSVYPPRIWSGRTEAEGFEEAPLREVATVSFQCSYAVAKKITERLRGVARVREMHTGKYRAIGLSSKYIIKIIKEELAHEEAELEPKAHPRSYAKRRELIDFPPSFLRGLLDFYYDYTKSILTKNMETIKIFLPEEEERKAQIIDWIITAIEKYNERSAVPFSGYLYNVVPRWTFDLPAIHLGKELAAFQKERNKALETLRKKYDNNAMIFSSQEISATMGISQEDFDRLEDQHKTWLSVKTSTTLHWGENNKEERVSTDLFTEGNSGTDSELASIITTSIIESAIITQDYESAYTIIDSIADNNVNNDSMGDIPLLFKETMMISMQKARSNL